jgi:outer membrane protein OmpA-like peptidoglycan-associated protein
MRIAIALGSLGTTTAVLLTPAQAAPRPTDLATVTADVAFLRQYDGVVHLGIVLHNSGTGDAQAATAQAITFADVVIVDAKANKKFFALKDANGHYLAGPTSDWNGGGRWFPTVAAGGDTIFWALFDAIPAGDTVSVQGPFFHTFNNLTVTTDPPPAGQELGSAVPPLTADLVSAERTNGELDVELKVTNPTAQAIRSRFSTVAYKDVYALDPQGKRSYPLLMDASGLYVATPMADKNNGGRWFLSAVPAGGQQLVELTFQAPPDTVKSVDIVLPFFPPFEAVAITGQGGAAVSGVAVAGQSADLQRVLKDLGADVTPQAIKVDLSADLLFDFDKAEVKSTAEPELAKVITVLKSYPDATVLIEGHTDAKGPDAYNQDLSVRRATAVATWLAAHGAGAKFQTVGWGETRPIAPNTNPDGSDNPDGRAKNRRVDITVTTG